MPVTDFKWVEDISEFGESSIKSYNEESSEGYFLAVDIEYTCFLCNLHNDLPFLPERMEIEKVENLVATLHDRTEYIIHIRNLRQVLNHRLVFKKVHKMVKFNKKD